MVITEKQNLQSSQADRRHRRMLERMNRMLVTPSRLSNRPISRPESESNPQSQTLRSPDLFGLERNNIEDANSHPTFFQSFFQSVFDTIRPESHTSLSECSVQDDKTVSSLGNRQKDPKSKPESDVHIIPITFLNGSNNTALAQSHKHIVIKDEDEPNSDIDNSDVIECDDVKTDTSNVYNENRTLVDVIDCDKDGTSKIDGCDTDIIDCDKTHSFIDKDKGSDIFVLDEDDDMKNCDVIECNTASLVRQSLPLLSLLERSKDKSNEDDFSSNFVLSVGSKKFNSQLQGGKSTLRTARSNKDTLVGGANKVLGDMGPDGYYKGENLDIPSGATFSEHVSTSQDVHSHSDEEKPVNDVPNYPVYLFLKKKLMKECRQIDHIKGDGNCFFRALSKQLYGSERYHIVLRNLIVDIIATNKSKFSQFVDDGDVQDHVERMSQEQSWATTCEIYAAATLLQRDIFMLTPDHLNEMYSWLLFKPVFKMDTQHSSIESHPCYITLCNTNGNHYDRIVAEHGGCNCFLPHPELDGVSYSVDLTC